MPRVVVADKLPDSALDALSRMGLEVHSRPGIRGAELTKALSGAAILIVRSAEVTRDIILGATELALIVRAGAGVNTIDVAAASERGVFVANCPGKNSIAVAELALGLICSIDRRIPDNVSAFRAGQWKKGEFGKARGLYGRAIGLAGFGRIGQELAIRAQACGMRVSVWSRSLTTEAARACGVEFAQSLKELASRVEILSLHLPLTSETRGLVDRALLSCLRPGSMLINTARAEIVDEEALVDAVRDRGLTVGLDVIRDEPAGASGTVDSPLREQDGVYVTHHIGASTEQAQQAITEETVRIVRAYLLGERIPNCVNVARQSPARYQLVVRHHDRPGVLAQVLGALRSRTINVEEMQNEIFEGARAACARIGLLETPGEDVLAEIRSHADIIDAQLIPISGR